ncbi:hypothetical protein SAMN05444581_11561 [Methylocapsa palsarum]|uniref:CopC domain-containing protein n=1 Tax=Methylocapsa palsarum TaxID=1612308 RepID=A0A1I4BJU8_9HYPH|nr:hypothetical protein SAMN05444581_11561 [Methylocapsa palsarum]
MRRRVKLFVVWILIALWPTATKALFRGQAILNRAVPGVGATVGLPPAELLLSFNHDVAPALSGVGVADSNGRSVPAGQPEPVAGRAYELRVRLGRALKPGVYTVDWSVVSRGAPSSGVYRFTVAP